MKNFLLYGTFLIVHFNMNAQTFIAPIIGYELAKIQDFDSLKAVETNLTLLDKGFSIGSPVIGVAINKILTKNVSITLSFEFTHKKIHAYNFSGITSVDAISYNYFKNNAAVNFLFGNYGLGIGGNYNLLSNIDRIYPNNIHGDLVNQIPEKGIRFSVARNINKFNLMIYLNKGLSSIQDENEELHLSRMTSFTLLLYYNIKI